MSLLVKELQQLGLVTQALLSVVLLALLGIWMGSSKKWIMLLRLPGPRPLPIIGNLHRLFSNGFDLYSCLRSIAHEFDGFFCFWICHVPSVAISAPEHLKTFYTSTHMIDRSDQYSYTRDLFGPSLFVVGGAQWKKLRKIFMVNFVSQTPIETIKLTFIDGANQLVEVIRPHIGGKTFKFEPILTHMTANNIMMNSVGEKIKDEEAAHILEAIDYQVKMVFWRNFYILTRSDFIFKILPQGRKFWRKFKYFDNYVKNLVLRKKAELEVLKEQGKPIPDLYIYNMLQNHGNESFDMLAGELKTLIVTGLDTTANTMGFTLTMIALYPDIQEKVFLEDQEVQKRLGAREIDLEDLNQYTYLECVFKETLRLFPVAGSIGRTVDTDTRFGKHLVPAGTNVIALQFYTNQNPEYFPDPWSFNPDRFLPENLEKIPPYAYNPFSIGHRSCPGMRYANLAMKLTLATIVRNYKIGTDVKSLDEAIKNVDSTFTLKDKNGHAIRIEARK